MLTLLGRRSMSTTTTTAALSIRRILDRGKMVEVKSCVSCHRDFTWRKKWERSWKDITTCSKRCNTQRKRVQRRASKGLVAATLSEGNVTTTTTMVMSSCPLSTPSLKASPLPIPPSILPLPPTLPAGSVLPLPTAEEQDLKVMNVATTESETKSETKRMTKSETKQVRKERRKRIKQQRRELRQGISNESYGNKDCQTCSK